MRAIVLSCGMGAGILAVRKKGGFPVMAWDDDQAAMSVARANFPDVPFAAPSKTPGDKIPHADLLVCKGWPKEAWSVLSVFSPRVIVSEGDVDAPSGYKAWSDDLEPSRFGAPIVGSRKTNVMIRDDVRVIFGSFPFPDGRPCVLRDVLDQGVSPDGLKGIRVPVNEPCRMPRAHKGASLVVPADGGTRRITRAECLRLFGFPPTYEVPSAPSAMNRMLCSSMIPTIIMAVIDELRVWVDLV